MDLIQGSSSTDLTSLVASRCVPQRFTFSTGNRQSRLILNLKGIVVHVFDISVRIEIRLGDCISLIHTIP